MWLWQHLDAAVALPFGVAIACLLQEFFHKTLPGSNRTRQIPGWYSGNRASYPCWQQPCSRLRDRHAKMRMF
ncbi:hypothetical protein [Nostoc piscinale]|uniref:hypothetical protein n=1 Tax=Nostoc piscinale TaxID=224012 RepID=UPI0039A6441E